MLTPASSGVAAESEPLVVDNELNRFRPFLADTFGVVIVSAGGTDLIHNYGRTPPQPEAVCGATLQQASPWVVDFARKLDGMVSRVKAIFPGGAEIFLLSIFDPTDDVGDIDHAELPAWPDGLAVPAACNRAIADCASSHGHVH